MSRENEKKRQRPFNFPPPSLFRYPGGKIICTYRYGCARVGEPRYTSYVNVSLTFLRILPISECFFLYRIAQQGDFFHGSIPPHRQTKYPTVVQMSPGISPGAMLPPAIQLRLSGDRIFMQTWMALVQTNLLLTPRGECDAMMSAFLSLSLSLVEKGYVCSLSSYYCKAELFYTFFRLTTPSNNSFPSPMMAVFFAIRHDIPD